MTTSAAAAIIPSFSGSASSFRIARAIADANARQDRAGIEALFCLIPGHRRGLSDFVGGSASKAISYMARDLVSVFYDDVQAGACANMALRYHTFRHTQDVMKWSALLMAITDLTLDILPDAVVRNASHPALVAEMWRHYPLLIAAALFHDHDYCPGLAPGENERRAIAGFTVALDLAMKQVRDHRRSTWRTLAYLDAHRDIIARMIMATIPGDRRSHDDGTDIIGMLTDMLLDADTLSSCAFTMASIQAATQALRQETGNYQIALADFYRFLVSRGGLLSPAGRRLAGKAWAANLAESGA